MEEGESNMQGIQQKEKEISEVMHKKNERFLERREIEASCTEENTFRSVAWNVDPIN